MDSAGSVYVASANRLLKVAPDGSITPVAGTGNSAFSGDGGPAVNASLRNVECVAIDAAGNIFVSDIGNHRVRRITAGIITTIAGNGLGDYSSDGGPSINASLNQPCGLAFDSAGNLYIGDYVNHLIRRIDSTGTIRTFAGRPRIRSNRNRHRQHVERSCPCRRNNRTHGRVFAKPQPLL